MKKNPHQTTNRGENNSPDLNTETTGNTQPKIEEVIRLSAWEGKNIYIDHKISMETHPHSRNPEWLLHREIVDGKKWLPSLLCEENNEESQPVHEENNEESQPVHEDKGASVSTCGWQEWRNGGMELFASFPT